VSGDWPGYSATGGDRIFGEFSRLKPCEVMLFPGQCIEGESPRGGGADGEGGRDGPRPCLDVSSGNLSRWITPTARPLRGLLPPPS